MEMLPSARFHIAVHRTHGEYFATVREIPGCVTRGASEVQAVENARQAIRAHRHLQSILSRQRPTAHVEISA